MCRLSGFLVLCPPVSTKFIISSLPFSYSVNVCWLNKNFNSCSISGEKTCLHIHGVFPYMYVPYTGEEDPTSLAYRLAASLDAAINVSLGSATSSTQHVYLIQRVSGM